MNLRIMLILSGILCWSAGLCPAQAAPVNDDFTNRIVLAGSSVTIAGTLQDATIESNEPYGTYAAGQQASVWWSWTASVSGPVTIELLNFSTNTLKLGGLDVWAGTNLPSGYPWGAVSLDGRHPFLGFSADAGATYQLRVMGTNVGDFTLKLTETNVPIILVQPLSRTVSVGESVFFGVVDNHSLDHFPFPPSFPPYSFQWFHNGIALAGETFAILGMDHLTTNDSGNYSVVVSNAAGSTISDTAVLNVTESLTPVQLTADSSSNGRFGFTILGDLGRYYRIQSSSNLTDWSEEKSFPGEFKYLLVPETRTRNGVVYNGQTTIRVPQTGAQKFYRAAPFVHAGNDAICINNLAKIHFAKEIWASQARQTGNSVSGPFFISVYIKNGMPFCPLDAFPSPCGACDYDNSSLFHKPTCRISPSHVLEEPEQ